jgi:hypothetical protein
MRILWTLFKLMVGLAIAIPVTLVVLAVTVGIVGTLVGLAVLALKLACIAFVAYGAFRVARHLFWPARKPKNVPSMRELPAVSDPYYQAAMRELDSELGPTAR